MPYGTRVLNKISPFFQRLISANVRHNQLSIRKRNFVLIFCACNSTTGAFDSDHCNFVRYTHPNLATLVRSDQSIADVYAANYGVRPRIVRNQKLSFDLNRCVMKVQLQIGALIRGHTVPYWTFAVAVEVSGSLPLPKFQVHLAHRFFATIPAHLSAPQFDADYR